jgi:putative DNA primase/helicase
MSPDRPPRPDPLAVEPDGVPDELRDRDQWVCWRYEWDADRDEWTKVPVDAGSGGYASSTDPDTWTSFDDALAYHDRDDRDTDGIGFVVHDAGMVVGLDLDDCRDSRNGEVDEWADGVLNDVRTYAEVSPSGTGLRLFGFGFTPEDGTRADVDGAAGHIEMYDTGRYLTVTGHHVDDTPEDLHQVNDEIADVHAEFIADDEEDTETSKAAGDGGVQAGSGGSNPTPEADSSGSLTDDELLERAQNAKNGKKFRSLWNGDTSGYPSHSEADLALVGLLAFWTGGERRRIDDLFRQSDLYREKWDRDDYRERTIDEALDGRTEFYEPSGPSNEPVQIDPDENSAPLAPRSVMAAAGLGEDDDISDLTDREKAARVWELAKDNEDVHIRVRRDNSELWAYDDGIWKPEGVRALRHAGRQALGATNYGTNVLGELKAQVRSDPRAEAEGDEFGLATGTMAAENGLVDLDTAGDALRRGDDDLAADARRDLRPDDLALTQLPVEYDPTAEYDEWSGYVKEWAEDGRADALQEYVGYCLHIGALPIHRALLLVGSGANGKGTFLAVVRALLGQENTSSIELQTLSNEKDAVADFYGSLANIDDDLSGRKLGAGLGMFKKLVGGDRVRARQVYKAGFEYDAVGKHLYAANEVPEVNVPDDDEAFWRRWLLVEFPNYYPPNERDPALRDELTEPEALSGVLNWAIEGRRRLLEQGVFTGEDRLAHDKRLRWQSWGDAVDEFISECVEYDEDAPRLSTGEAFERFKAWCRANGKDHDGGQQSFTSSLKTEGVGYGKHRMDGSVQRGYKALELSDDVPDPSPDDGQQERFD